MSIVRALAVCLFAASALALPACGNDAPPPVETQPVSYEQPTGPKPKPIVKPSAAQMAKVKASFDAAGRIVEQARAARKAGEALERSSGRPAALEKYREAKKLYRTALQDTEEWIEEELGPFSQAQIDKYLGMFLNERARWQKESAGMGKMND